MDLAGRSAVIAGGAGGLGGATVRRLTALGVGVVVLDTDTERSAALVTELGDRVTAVAGGSNDDAARAAATLATPPLGVVSNAGIATGLGLRSPRRVQRAGVILSQETQRPHP